MKIYNGIMVFAICLVSYNIFGQTVSYTINLSNPGKEGFLNIDVYNTGIKVAGYEGEDVQLTILDHRNKKDQDIGSSEFYFQILENNNEITIVDRKSRPNRKVKGLDLELKVPRNFSATLATYYGKRIEVSGITGDVDVTGYFTDLILRGLKEDVVANTNQGTLVASFDDIKASNVLFISSYKGDIELVVPEHTKATLAMDNYFGKLETDFKLELNTKSTRKEDKDFVHRLINGGGAELKIVNYYGKIKLKSKGL